MPTQLILEGKLCFSEAHTGERALCVTGSDGRMLSVKRQDLHSKFVRCADKIYLIFLEEIHAPVSCKVP